MPKVLQFKTLQRQDTITQYELEELARELEMKVHADARLMSTNLAILQRIKEGAVVEPGKYTYHKNLGVSKL